jgi:REP element-mobilizing transposase RayT
MPNHVHGLIGIMNWPQSAYEDHYVTTRDLASLQDGQGSQALQQDRDPIRRFGPLKSGGIPAIIQSYKASVTREARKRDDHDFAWHPRFHNHIVRNDRAFNRIRDYITNNPLKWNEDRFSFPNT